jgi:hypothetical protein
LYYLQLLKPAFSALRSAVQVLRNFFRSSAPSFRWRQFVDSCWAARRTAVRFSLWFVQDFLQTFWASRPQHFRLASTFEAANLDAQVRKFDRCNRPRNHLKIKIKRM